MSPPPIVRVRSALAPVLIITRLMFVGGPRNMHEAEVLSLQWPQLSYPEKSLLLRAWERIAPTASVAWDVRCAAKAAIRGFIKRSHQKAKI